MPRVNLEDRFFADSAFRMLALAVGVHLNHARGATAAIWHQCLIKLEDILPPELIDDIAGVQGFADALCDRRVRLGEVTEDGVRLVGVQRRIDALTAYSATQRQRVSMRKDRNKRKDEIKSLPAVEARYTGGLPSGSGSGSDLDLSTLSPTATAMGSQTSMLALVPEPQKAPRAKRPKVDQPPIPFTIADLLDVFADHAPSRATIQGFDRRLAKPLTDAIRATAGLDPPATIADLEAAAAHVERTWKEGYVTAGYLARAGTLCDLILRARKQDGAKADAFGWAR